MIINFTKDALTEEMIRSYTEDKTVYETKYIDMPEGAKYLKEVMTDLPQNAFVNKGVTDCGGTTLAITNDEKYIIAVHSIALLENKCEQHNNLFGFHGKVTTDQLAQYVEAGGKKIIATYDAIPRIIDTARQGGINPKEFKVLVDETQVLIRYMPQFKSKVCNELIDNISKFKSVVYMTATPPPRKYLPKPIRDLDYYEIRWKNVYVPKINHKFTGSNTDKETISYILENYRNNNNDIFVFYNSKSGVSKVLNKILENDIKLNEINLFFANTEENIKYFKKNVNKNIEISIPLSKNKKRINFVSSFGFEGVDFYNKDVSILVVSNPKYKSMRYDISIDLPQIIGRFRACTDADINFLWASYSDEITLTEQEYASKVKRNYDNTVDAFSGSNLHNEQIKFAFVEMLRKKPNPLIYLVKDCIYDPKISLNKYAFESAMSGYHAMHCDYNIPKHIFEEIKNGDKNLYKYVHHSENELIGEAKDYDKYDKDGTLLEYETNYYDEDDSEEYDDISNQIDYSSFEKYNDEEKGELIYIGEDADSFKFKLGNVIIIKSKHYDNTTYKNKRITEKQANEHSPMLKKLKELYEVHDLHIPELSQVDNFRMGNRVNFRKLCLEYINVLEDEDYKKIDFDNITCDNGHILSKLENILNCSEMLRKYHNVITIQEFKKCNFIKARLETMYKNKILISKIKPKQFKLNCNEIYPTEYIKKELLRLYDKYDIDLSFGVKCVDIKNWFDIKQTTYYSKRTKSVTTGYKIVKAK